MEIESPAYRTKSRIAVFRALYLGDMLCLVPALRALRGRYPEAEISLIGLPWAREFCRRFDHYIDEFIEFPGYPGLKESRAECTRISEFLWNTRKRRLDMVLQMHGNGDISNTVVSLLGARRTAGFYRNGKVCPDARTFIMYPDDVHEVRKLLMLVNHLGCESRGEDLEFPLFECDFDELKRHRILSDLNGKKYVCLHPGSREVAKRWSIDGFAAVGDALSDEGFEVVITGASQEAVLASEVSARMRRGCINAASCSLSIGGLAALMSHSALVVSNDTGASHLASALGIRSIIVFLAPMIRTWAPLNGVLHKSLYNPEGVSASVVIAEALSALRQGGLSCVA